MLTLGAVHAGHVFPGANLPFGMAKSVADVNGERQGGFALDNSGVTGFSHMHGEFSMRCWPGATSVSLL